MDASSEVYYPEIVLPRLRFKFCPMCRTPLQNRDGDKRVVCPSCGWIHYLPTGVGANVIIRVGTDQVALIFPPNAPADAPAATVGGHVELGESPEEAAVREAKEETGLKVKIVKCLGWMFQSRTRYPGPMVHFMFEAEAVGGEARGSEEGEVRILPIDNLPAVSPDRLVSRKAIELFLASPGK